MGVAVSNILLAGCCRAALREEGAERTGEVARWVLVRYLAPLLRESHGAKRAVGLVVGATAQCYKRQNARNNCALILKKNMKKSVKLNTKWTYGTKLH